MSEAWGADSVSGTSANNFLAYLDAEAESPFRDACVVFIRAIQLEAISTSTETRLADLILDFAFDSNPKMRSKANSAAAIIAKALR